MFRTLCAVALIGLPAVFAGGTARAQDHVEMPWAIAGTGGAHLLVEPGELEIRVLKRDLNIFGARGAELRAMLIGPDREVLDEMRIPSSGSAPGAHRLVQSEVLRTSVEAPGAYMLKILTPGDRHGLNIEWALETNASRWVVETARGHRDERHREPIVMNDAGRSADIYFLPRRGEFGIEVEALPPEAGPLTLYDADGAVVAEIPVMAKRSVSIRDYMRMPQPEQPEASATFTVPAGTDRDDRPWRLHLPRARFYLEIDGLTHWESDDLYQDQNVWSPVAESWFPFLDYRWLIGPYQRTAYTPPGERGHVTFVVHNNSRTERSVDLALEFPGGEWEAGLSKKNVVLAPRGNREIAVRFAAPPEGEERIARVRATPREAPEITTYATLRMRGGESPVGKPLDLPHVLAPFAHENHQFGYLPGYPVDHEMYFDLENRGFVVAGNLLHREVAGEWVATDLRHAVVRTIPEVAGNWSARASKVAFDGDNNVYLLGGSGRAVALLRSTDGGETFTAYVIAGREDEPRSWDIEQFSGHNVPNGPPAIVRLTQIHVDDEDVPTARRDPRVRWRRTNELELFVADETADGDIAFHKPVKVTRLALGTAMHSGIPSTIVSRDSKIHVVWGEATDPQAGRDEIPGVPGYVATYDRETRTLGEPVFLSFGPPPNNVHNTPGVTMDSEGYLHAVIGTHGQPFQYLRSLEPNDITSGWTEATPTSEKDLRQTYVGLVCDAEDALHLVFRLWMTGEEHLDGGGWPALAHQRKPAGGEWSAPRVLVAPPLAEYGIYYHRLTVDHTGELFLNYDYWSTSWFYRNDARGPVAAGSGRPGRGWGRSLMTSPDSGETWRLHD